MNRFERLFFILERNPEEPMWENRDVRGVVKIVLTAEQVRVMWEINGLPAQQECQYAIGVFLKKTGDERAVPQYFSFQPNPHGYIRTETMLPYKLQEGETILGVALSVTEKKTNAKRRFPLLAFQNMRGPWRSILQESVASEVPQKAEGKQQPSQQKSQPQSTPCSRIEQFQKNFTNCDPFGTTNPAYHWWKNADMHRVNQVLAEMELTLPLELNKDGYLACGLFGHVLLGLYTDSALQREFFILGIPAKSKEDSGNYYSHSRWESIGRQTAPEQEEKGYWLTYMDCTTSKVVKVV